ncbi:hypothetical protein Goarm_021355, partial [Gossypium armourianum]|nr:hypothetical protein [Gossypium armourianum]
MLSTVEEHVDKLEEFMEDVKESHNALGERINDLWEQSRDFVTMCLTSNRDNALNTRIEELEGELALCRAAMGEEVSSTTFSYEDVPKPKKFVGTRSIYDVDNFLWRMENYFRAKGIVDDAVKGQFYPKFVEEKARAKLRWLTQRGTVGEYVRELKELMLQVSDVGKKEALLTFQNRLKTWVRQEVEQRGVQKLSEAITVVKSIVKLGLRKDKHRSSKTKERGVCEKDHKEDIDGNGIGDNSGNGKPRVGKKKPNKKMDKLKCSLYNGPYMLKKCLKKSEISKEERPIGKFEAKRAKRSKKKRVKCFLCHGPYELQNCLKQSKSVVVKEKATSELVESLEGLPDEEDV